MKIGVLGKMCSGKSTLARKIVNLDKDYEIYNFGSKVEEIAKDLFKMTEIDRYMLQNIDESMKKIDKDVWVDYLLDKIKTKDKIIIDDVQYKNEILKLKENGFKIVYLSIEEDEQNHNSEKVDDLKYLANYEYIPNNNEINKIINIYKTDE